MYADITDQADAEIELRLAAALANRPRPVPFTGKCLNCKSSIEKGHYCCSACREDAEKHERAARFNRH